jgi:germination protein M
VPRVARLAPVLLVLAATACGSTRTVTVTVTRTVAGPEPLTAPVRVYLLRDGKLAPVRRVLPLSRQALLAALAKGPTPAERAAGLATGSGAPRALLAESVYTLGQLDPAAPVELGGKRYTRADFEDVTPPILVESPLPFDTVHGPQLHASGTANTFEATFDYELLDGAGRALKKGFVTATSGSGTRGTFDFEIPFAVDREQDGKLVVFESSAENGQPIHRVEIPLRLAP